jgi:hypothetical protein
MEVAADRAGVSGRADRADPLACEESVAWPGEGRPGQVRVEVAAALAVAVDEEVVAVELRVMAYAADTTSSDGDERRSAACDDVEALVGASAAARRAELADRAAGPVRSRDREDVAVKGGPARGGRVRRPREGAQGEQGEKSGPGQWCSMTRSTRLYSLASSALMK